MRSYLTSKPAILIALLALVLSGSSFAATQPSLDMLGGSSQLVWYVNGPADGATLVISVPDGRMLEAVAGPGEPLSFSPFDLDAALPDGVYTWEIVVTPKLSSQERQLAEAERAAGLSPAVQLDPASGAFSILGGSIVWDDATIVEGDSDGGSSVGGKVAAGAEGLEGLPTKQFISSDLTVHFSACIGGDCATSESYGSDTLRLKENNLRIHFDDTSNSASFPNNDWRITANSSDNGAASFLSIQDATAGTTPFYVGAGAGNNALYVENNTGDIGVGTAAPVVEVHVADGDTPTMRLEQNGSSGFATQTWDLAGNETNFFVRNVTNGSRLPFRIFPTSEDDAVVLRNSGVGIFTDNPSASLHIRRTDETAKIFVEEANGTASANARTLMQLTNNGKLDFRLSDTNSGNTWKFENDPNAFLISLDGSGATEFGLTNAGSLVITGTLTEGSDVNTKENFEAIEPAQILAEVLELPITTWSYINDEPTVRHIGPMAQDFHAAFGFGGTETGIQPRNLSAVALAAIQGLDADVKATLTAELEKKQQKIDELESRLAALEALIQAQAAQ
ncbi:MAG: tail fiber domain-containing protein [Acidobacteriota bacterium]